MAKGKKKGKKKKGAKQEKPEGALTEVDKTFYEITITDLNRKLARLRATNIQLEEKNVTLNEQLNKLDDDRNDVIIYLKRILQERTEEINELQAGTAKLQETLEQDAQENTQKIDQMETDYKQMQEQLTSEIKLLEGKLNALEEFRLQREDLMRKFETQEEDIEEQEKKHKRAIYETERKFVIAKDKLKKEMEARLLQLSTEFQDATEIRIAATTHRVIRENIAINNELDEMLTVHKRLYSENQEMKQRDRTLRQHAQLHNAEKNKALGRSQIQKKIIEELTTSHSSMSKQLEKYKRVEKEMHDAREEAYKTTLKYQSLENKTRVLEQNLHSVRAALTETCTESAYYKSEAQRLAEVLLEAVGAIKEATRIIKTQRITDKSTLAHKRETLVNNLFKLLITAKETRIKKDSLPSVSSTESVYKKGDLGFIPPVSEFRTRLRAIRNIQSQTGTSLVEDSELGKRAEGITTSLMDNTIEDRNVSKEEESVLSDVFFDENESTEEEEEEGEKTSEGEEEDESELFMKPAVAKSNANVPESRTSQ